MWLLVRLVVVGRPAETTVKLWVTCVAAFQLVLPVWLALIVQVPAPMKETTPPLIEQTELDELAIVSATARPEVAFALGV